MSLHGFKRTLASRAPSASSLRRHSHKHFSSTPCYKQQDQSDFLETFIQSHQPPQQTVDYFTSIPWAKQILSDNAYEIVPFFSRHFISHSGENSFFSQTVNTKATIPHLLSLRLKDMKTPDSIPKLEDSSPITTPEVLILMSLGKGLEAHPGIVHGGFQCVIFDEIMRFLILLHWNNLNHTGPRIRHYTVNMATKYLAAVHAPSDVLVRAHLVGRERRKWMTKAEVVSGQDGRVLTSAESMWVTAKPAGKADVD